MRATIILLSGLSLLSCGQDECRDGWHPNLNGYCQSACVVLTYQVDKHANGRVDSFFQRTYDDQLRMTTEVARTGDEIRRKTATYSEDGRTTYTEEFARDSAEPERRYSETRNAEGRPLIWTWDGDADGSVDTTVWSTWDDEGRQLSTAVDGDGDGRPDSGWSKTYTLEGRVLIAELDEGSDGTIDGIIRSQADRRGHVLWHEHDRGPNGVVDTRITQTYDRRGNPVRNERFTGEDLVAVEEHTYRDGFLLTRSRDRDGDGIVDHFTEFENDGDGNPVVQQFTDYELESASRIERTFDAGGNVLTQLTTHGSGLVVLSTRTYLCP